MIDLTKLSQALSVPCKLLPRNILAFTLWTQGDTQLQLFIVPPYTFVPDHVHPSVEIEVTPLSGKVEARRSGRKVVLQGCGYNKSHFVKAGESHGFSTFNEPFVFLTKQWWINGVKPKSLEEEWAGDNPL